MRPAGFDRLGRSAGLAALSLSMAAAPLPAVAAIVAAAAVFALPVAGLAGAAFATPFGGSLQVATAAGALTITPLLLAWTAVPWLLTPLAHRRLPRIAVPVAVPLAAFVGALTMSALRAPDLAASVFEIARWLELGLALVLVVGLVRSPRMLVFVVLAVLAAGSAAGVVAIWMALEKSGPDAFAVLGGRILRAYGTFGQPNPFGGYMNMVWPIGLGLALAWLAPTAGVPGRLVGGPAPTFGRSAWALLLPAGVFATLVAGLGLVLSWSRGAWLAAAVGAAAALGLWAVGSLRPPVSRRNVLAVGLVGGALLCVALLALGRSPGSVTARLRSVADTFIVWDVADAEVDAAGFATIERVAHWQAAAAMWADAPWLGKGPGHYEIFYAEYRLPRWKDALGHAHNYYLQLLAESGIVGLFGYCVFFGACVVLAVRAGLRPVNDVHRALGIGLVGVLAAIAFHSLVDNVYVHETTVHLGLVLGLTVAAGSLRPTVRSV